MKTSFRILTGIIFLISFWVYAFQLFTGLLSAEKRNDILIIFLVSIIGFIGTMLKEDRP